MSTASLTAAQTEILERYDGGFFRKNRYRLMLGFIVVYTAFCFWLFDIDLARLITGIDKMWIVIRSMVYWKDFWSWDFWGIAVGMAQTLAMAFLGTVIASLFALPIGFMAAHNVNPFGPLRHLVRRFLDVLRGVDTLIWALIYVRAVGLGPLAGVLAIITSDTGTLSKLYSEAIENIDNKQVRRRALDRRIAHATLSFRHDPPDHACVPLAQPLFLRKQHALGHDPGDCRCRRHRPAAFRAHARRLVGSSRLHHHHHSDHRGDYRHAIQDDP